MRASEKDKKKSGFVSLVGAGPGDPGLLTLNGVARLAAADTVIYDRLVNRALLDWAPQAEKIDVGKATTNRKKRRKRGVDQNEIYRLIETHALRGKKVVRLKGGDPLIFGRGGEEAFFLKKRKIAYEIVPGITAGYAAPAYAGIPVTDRRLASSVVFATAHEGVGKEQSTVDWNMLARFRGTLVLYMAIRNLASVLRALLRGGRPPETPVCVIEWGTLPDQRTIEGTLGDIARKVRRHSVGSPSVVVVGETVRLRKELAWFDQRPLSGKTVLITRAAAQAGRLREMLEGRGARVFEFPTIRILPPRDWRPLDRTIAGLGQFDWMFLTSPNGVRYLMERLFHRGFDSRRLGALKIAAIGEGTKTALREYGIQADFVPKHYTSEALVREFARVEKIRGKRFLLPRTDIAPAALRLGLERRGGRVTQVVTYRTGSFKNARKRNELVRLLERERVDFITFTSSSTAKHFFEALPKKNRRNLRGRLVSIGPVTTQTLKHYGFRPYGEAREHTIPGLVEVLSNGHS